MVAAKAAGASVARKTPAAKAAGAAAVLEGEVVAQPAPADGQEPPARTALAEFHGRQIAVKAPAPEQLAVYRRVVTRFEALQHAGDGTVNGEEALKYFDRALKVITSVMINPQDVEWLEDKILDGMTLATASELLKVAMDQLTSEDDQPANRAERRASRARRTT